MCLWTRIRVWVQLCSYQCVWVSPVFFCPVLCFLSPCVRVCVFSYRYPAEEKSQRHCLWDLRTSPRKPHFTGRNYSQRIKTYLNSSLEKSLEMHVDTAGLFFFWFHSITLDTHGHTLGPVNFSVALVSDESFPVIVAWLHQASRCRMCTLYTL